MQKTTLPINLRRRIFAVLTFCLMLIPCSALGQNQVLIEGTVISATDGEPLIGATVREKNSQKGVSTDVNGKYSLSVSTGSTMIVSYIGYIEQAFKVSKGKNIYDIKLVENSEILDEVVVVGYGTMKRSDITGSVVSVTGDELRKNIATSVDQALQGKAAGVTVTNNSGAPGGGISVSIRGLNSLNGNEPLYVIDGIALSGQTDGNSSALSSLSPSDIESMEVLKDASATAIYGSRASNGVVLITTKQGKAGRTKVSYDGYVGWQKLPKQLDVLNLREYAEYMNHRSDVLGWGWREEFADPSILGEGTNWQSEIFRTAPMTSHSINVSGGNEKTVYAISGGYMSQNGIAIGSDFERFNLRTNIDTHIAKWLKVGANLSAARTKKHNTIDNASIITTALSQLPEVPAKNPDGSWGMAELNDYGIYFSNPVAEALMRENYNKGLDLNYNLYANIILPFGFDIRVEYGGNYNYNNWYYYQPTYEYPTYTQVAQSQRRATNSSYSSFKTYLTWTRDFGKNHIQVMAGHEAQQGTWETLWGQRDNYFINSVTELDPGDALTAKNASNKNDWAIESYYGRLNYSWDDRYLLTATLRADGSSAFGPNNRWGWFPSVALAWRIKNESFLRDVEAINALKLRLGWGLVGNQNAGNFAYGASMTSDETIWGSGFHVGNYPNANLKWEKTNSYNIGLDLALFNNRLEFIIDAYYKKTDNLLMKAALPYYGKGGENIITAPWINTGALLNKGFEFTLNTINISNRSFQWSSSLTFSLNRNKVTKLNTESSGIQGDINRTTYTYTQEGQPLAQFYGYKVKGMIKTPEDFYQKDRDGNYLLDASGNRKIVALPTDQSIGEGSVWYGDFLFEDLNNDGVIDEKDRTYIGNPEPKFTLGFTNNFTWRDFDASIFLHAVVGNKVFNYVRQQYANPSPNAGGRLKEVVNHAVVGKIDPEGGNDFTNYHVVNAETATIQRVWPADLNNNNRVSDRFVEDASYLRVKNIVLGYTLPGKLTRKAYIERLRFYVNIQNPFTITGYDGYDPEIGAYNQGVLLRGIDHARYPTQRIYTIGLNINF